MDEKEVQSEFVESHRGVPAVVFDEVETKRILRRMDLRIVPVLATLYLLAFLDRSNLGNAKIAGMMEDLNLTGTQYNIAATMFFIPYALFEVPSNIVLKHLKPRIWISILMLSWGTVMTLMGIVQNYPGLVVARVFLGITEAGFFPAATYLLTCWYPRHELQLRIGYFYAAGALSGAFSGLLAYAIEKMHGVGNLAGWRWIFILEGLLTCAIAFTGPWILYDDPSTAKFLNPEERRWVAYRISSSLGRESTESQMSEKFQWKYFWLAVRDWKVWLSIVVFWGNSLPIYGFIYTLPTVIQGLGYTSANAQLLTIPVYFVALSGTVAAAYFSDKYQTRSPFIIFPQLFGAVGFIIIMAIPKHAYPGAVYGCLFIIALGLYTTITGIVSWLANNLAGSNKRAVGMALQISIGNFGGAVGSNIYLAKQAPDYWLGFGMSMAILILAATAAATFRILLQRINAQRDAMNQNEIRAKYTEDELWEMGDQSPLFRYSL